MDEELVKVTPNKEKAKSILKMVETTLEMLHNIDADKFPSNLTKEYYDIIRELISIILLLDGYKTYGEGAHKKQIDYLGEHYNDFNEYELGIIDDLRVVRNRISYDGFFVEKGYIQRKLVDLKNIIIKLKKIINHKLEL